MSGLFLSQSIALAILPGMLRIVLTIAVLALAAPASAKVYKWVLEDGTVIFSDRPQDEKAEEVELRPTQTYTAPTYTAPTPTRNSGEGAGTAPAGDDKPFTGYKKFDIVSPAHDAVIRENTGAVTVSLQLDPVLQSGHQIEVKLDGKVLGKGASPSVALNGVPRGTHSLEAIIKDESGRTVATASPVLFHLKQHAARN